MLKLKLDPELLRVQSFQTLGSGAQREDLLDTDGIGGCALPSRGEPGGCGTVHAHADTCPTGTLPGRRAMSSESECCGYGHAPSNVTLCGCDG